MQAYMAKAVRGGRSLRRIVSIQNIKILPCDLGYGVGLIANPIDIDLSGTGSSHVANLAETIEGNRRSVMRFIPAFTLYA